MPGAKGAMPTAAMQVPAGLFAGVILKAGVPRSGRSTPFRINARAPLISANAGATAPSRPPGLCYRAAMTCVRGVP